MVGQLKLRNFAECLRVCEHFLCAPPLAALPFTGIFLSRFHLNLSVSGDRVKGPRVPCPVPVPRKKALGRTWKRQGTNKTNLKVCRKEEFTRTLVAVPLIFP